MKTIKHYLSRNPEYKNRAKRPGALIFNISDIWTKEFIEDWRRSAELEQTFDMAQTQPEKWNALRRIYEYHTPEIIQASSESLRSMIDPYLVDWTNVFSPIEEDAWQSIRCYGIPLYPQYPVGRYFIDFAIPYLKIGVEMDGKDYHDLDKDRIRDRRLLQDGWRIFRIPGRECYTKFKFLYDIEEMERDGCYREDIERELDNYFMNQSDGVFKAIDIVYFRGSCQQYLPYAHRSLNAHKIIDFMV